jgi:CII-binding regulator of phage lambda lysogenization HflD
MTNDETQRNMDFIVAQQARFSADIQHLKELHVQADKRFAKTEDTLTRIASATLTLTQRMMELAEAQAQMNSKMTELAASQEHTDQRLNALIDIVRNGRNGKG